MDTTTIRYYREPGDSPVYSLRKHHSGDMWLQHRNGSPMEVYNVTDRMIVGTHGELYFACTSDGALLHIDTTPAPTIKESKSAWDTQVGGSHYTYCAIQPFQYSMANKLDPMQHTAIKYITRFRSKGGIVDLRKAIQTIELLIQWEQDNDSTSSSTPINNGGNGNGQSGACAYPVTGASGY